MALPKIAAPKYELTVPSTGERVKYRPYLVKEEKLLMIAVESKDEGQMMNALKDVISGCTEGKVKPDKLKPFDLEYIFLQLRSKSVGENAKILVKCTHCETRNEVIIDLNEIEVKGEMIDEMNIKLTDNVGMVLKYPSIKEIQRNQASNKGKKNQTDLALSSITSMISSIYEGEEVYLAENETQQSLTDFIESLSSDQFKKIYEFVSKMPKVTHKAEFKCVKCSEQNDVVLEGLQSFF